jgi:hypothetical protein
MRRMGMLGVALMMALALASCGKKTEYASETTSDSLLAANPVETPQGNITPQSEYQQESQKNEAPPAVKPAAKPKTKTTTTTTSEPRAVASNPGITVPAGTGIKINVKAAISSETAQPGDAWTGEVTAPVVIGTAAPIPAGSTVQGVVSGVKAAEKGSRAFLVLSVRTIDIGGRTHNIHATADSIIAGSTRARNLGAIAGSAAAGALIGKAIGGGGKGALVGGLLGAAAGTGAVAGTKGYQVVLKEGTELTFVVEDAVVMN